jgi:exopolysaccharide biosynthesis polyprenyl glycosylphosphotransferase
MLRRQRQIRKHANQFADAILFGVAFWLAHWVRSRPALDVEQLIHDFSWYSWLLFIIVPFAPAAMDLEGCYQTPGVTTRRQYLLRSLRAALWVSLSVIVVLYFRKAEGARGVMLLFVPFVLALLWAKMLAGRWLGGGAGAGGRAPKKRLIVISGGESIGAAEQERFERSLGLDQTHDVEIVARLRLNDITPGGLAARLHDTSANAVVISPRSARFDAIESAIQVCELEGVEVWLLADFFQTRLAQARADELNGRPTLVFCSAPPISWQAVAKDAIDVVGSLVMLALTSWIFALAAIAIKLTSPGPVFFRQQRAGLNGAPFTMYKFRTMVTNAEQLKQELAVLNEMSGPVFKVSNDPRITKVGWFLRKWSIDELPQLWNVLRGEMSLVGPRPLPVDEVARFDDDAHRRRLSVKPGLTCLWQVSGRNNVRNFEEWVRLDLEYIDNWSLWLDLHILFRTVPAVLTAAGAK